MVNPRFYLIILLLFLIVLLLFFNYVSYKCIFKKYTKFSLIVQIYLSGILTTLFGFLSLFCLPYFSGYLIEYDYSIGFIIGMFSLSFGTVTPFLYFIILHIFCFFHYLSIRK